MIVHLLVVVTVEPHGRRVEGGGGMQINARDKQVYRETHNTFTDVQTTCNETYL